MVEHDARITYAVSVKRDHNNHVYPPNDRCKVSFDGENITVRYADDPQQPESQWSVYKGKRHGRHYFLERQRPGEGWSYLLLMEHNTLVGWWNESGEGEGLWSIQVLAK
jgi:hypothetical protein